MKEFQGNFLEHSFKELLLSGKSVLVPTLGENQRWLNLAKTLNKELTNSSGVSTIGFGTYECLISLCIKESN